MPASHQKQAKVTKADYDRAAAFLQSMGAKAAAVEISADRVRIITTDGGNLTLGSGEASLDQELAEFRRANGYG